MDTATAPNTDTLTQKPPIVTFTVLCSDGSHHLDWRYTDAAQQLGTLIGHNGYNLCHDANRGGLSGRVFRGFVDNKPQRPEQSKLTFATTIDHYLNVLSTARLDETSDGPRVALGRSDQEQSMQDEATDVAMLFGGHRADEAVVTRLEQWFQNFDNTQKQLWLLNISNSYDPVLSQIAQMVENNPEYKPPHLVTSVSDMKPLLPARS